MFTEWNALEDECCTFFGNIGNLGYWQARFVLHALPSSRARLDVVLATARYVLYGKPTRLKEVESVFDHIGRRLDSRNMYAHGFYVTDENNVLHLLRPKYDDRVDPRHIQVVEIPALKRELEEIAIAFSRIRALHDILLRPLAKGETSVEVSVQGLHPDPSWPE